MVNFYKILSSLIINRFLLLLLLLAFFLRIILIFLPGFQIDMDAWFAWAIRLNQTGFSNFYSDQIWTNYTPGYLYILALLGFIKNIFQIADVNFYFLLKIPAIIAEITLAVLVYRQFVKKSFLWAGLAAGLILLNPAFIFNSSIWGQIDGLLGLMLVLSIYFLIQRRLILSSILWSLAFLIKPQAIALLPVFALFLIKNLSLKNFLKIIIPTPVMIFLLSLPFFINKPLGIINLFSKMVSDYPYTSLFAYNLWGIVGFWIKDNITWNSLPYQNWGYFILGGYWATIIYFYLKKNLSIYALATLATLSFFFLPTRVHERYLYPAIVCLILTAAHLKSRLLLSLTGILSLLHFLNLYYVYIYYNQFYLKLPEVIYNPIIYNFLAENSKNLSLVSTIVFISISISIIRKHANLKKA